MLEEMRQQVEKAGNVDGAFWMFSWHGWRTLLLEVEGDQHDIPPVQLVRPVGISPETGL